MSTKWQGNLIKFDLHYWVIQEREEVRESLTGSFQFDVSCNQLEQLEDNNSRKTFEELSNIVQNRLGGLITNLSKKHRLTFEQVLDIVSHAMEDNNVNIDTIETDDERDLRLKERERQNKYFFDKYSDEL